MEPKFIKQYHPELFSWKELEYLINIRPLMTQKRSHILFEEETYFKWRSTGWQKDKNCYPPTLIRKLIEENICYFTDMSRCTEKINAFAKSLEDEYEHQTDAHIYMCRNIELEHPFGAHFDTSHNVIVQCEGTTNFKVWNGVDPKSNYTKMTPEELPGEPVLDVEMEPGDAIWIPMYYPHLATSRTKRLSVSFAINKNPLKEGFEDREWVRI
tara:strand:+ start:308 stop:943 length:636 start_codon:yes stop_codon:yes gene_type:complete